MNLITSSLNILNLFQKAIYIILVKVSHEFAEESYKLRIFNFLFTPEEKLEQIEHQVVRVYFHIIYDHLNS
jgi:hypothetical protein